MKKLHVFLSLIIALLFMSCNQVKLSDNEAESLIRKSLNLPQSYSISLTNSMTYTNSFDLLQQSGLLTWNWKWANDDGGHSFDFDVNLSDKIKPFLMKTSTQKTWAATYDVYEFKTNEFDLGKITGISINKENQTATVRFLLIATNINEIARSLQNTKVLPFQLNSEFNGELVFKKFDNGWQLESSQNKSAEQLLFDILGIK